MSSISHILSAQEPRPPSASNPSSASSSSSSYSAAATTTASSTTATAESSTAMSDPPISGQEPASQPQQAASKEEQEDESSQQRKRSKVSRACDECRRKKIRCDAVLNSSNKLEKQCSSCVKNGYVCLFERVPLKRGPTKGFVKLDHMGNWDSKQQQQQQQQQRQQQIPSHQSHKSQGSLSSITLPPLTSLTNNVPFHQQQQQQLAVQQPQPGPVAFNFNHHNQQQQHVSQSVSPRRMSSNPSQMPVPPPQQNNLGAAFPQSQFWKVPYQAPFDRRGSVDSISSSVSDSRFSSVSSSSNVLLQPRYESSVISDTEDERIMSPRLSIDLRNPRSRSNSNSTGVGNSAGPSSPALSISSLKSLNQGISKNLTLNSNNSSASLQSLNVVTNNNAQINTNHLIDIYYRFIHPNFPILPLNSQFLITILSKPPVQPPQNEFDELSFFLTQTFYSSLDLLISTLSRQRSPINSPNTRQTLNQSNENLYAIFNNLSRVFKKFVLEFGQFPQHCSILLLSIVTLLSLTVVLLGESFDTLIISTSVKLFDRLKIFKLFWPDNNPGRPIANFDEYELLLRRLYLNMNLLDSLYSISHGLPRSSVLDLDFDEIDKLFPDITIFESMKDNLKLGLILSTISQHRTFYGSFLTANSIITDLRNKIPRDFTSRVEGPNDSSSLLAIHFLESILAKFELISYLEEVASSFPQNSHKQTYDGELLTDYSHKLLRLIRKSLTAQAGLFSSVKNHTNSIDSASGLPISPMLPLIFKQSIKTLNIMKILINSLQLNEYLVVRSSKLLNDLIKLSNFLSLIKPMLNPELNDHLKFELNSSYLEFWDEFQENDTKRGIKYDEAEVQEKWTGLMRDVLKYLKEEDYEGWF